MFVGVVWGVGLFEVSFIVRSLRYIRTCLESSSYRSVLQCVAVCCSVLQCVAVCCQTERVMLALYIEKPHHKLLGDKSPIY